jgi:hypothetical protein
MLHGADLESATVGLPGGRRDPEGTVLVCHKSPPNGRGERELSQKAVGLFGLRRSSPLWLFFWTAAILAALAFVLKSGERWA